MLMERSLLTTQHIPEPEHFMLVGVVNGLSIIPEAYRHLLSRILVTISLKYGGTGRLGTR